MTPPADAPMLEDRARRLISDARATILGGRRGGAVDATLLFFSAPAMRLRAEPSWAVDTMATDGVRLLFNPQFTCGLTGPEVLGVVLHEVAHCCLLHFARLEGRNPTRWNVAADCAVNWILKEAGIVLPKCRLMPGEGDFAHLPGGQSAEWYYDRLPEDEDGGGGLIGDVLSPPSPSDGGGAALEAAWQIATAAAAEYAKGRGTLPGTLSRMVGEVVDPPLPWRAVLRDFVSRQSRDDFSWSRPNRRFVGAGVYLPGMHSECLGEMAVAVDTSGSISADTLAAFANELNAILDSYPMTCHVIYCDADVKRVDTFTSDDRPVTLDPVGGGGTDHAPVVDEIERRGWDLACAVFLTDGATACDRPEPGYPVLWAIDGNYQPRLPWGKILNVGA
jgi:predicted metal-dependent peptidase